MRVISASSRSWRIEDVLREEIMFLYLYLKYQNKEKKTAHCSAQCPFIHENTYMYILMWAENTIPQRQPEAANLFLSPHSAFPSRPQEAKMPFYHSSPNLWPQGKPQLGSIRRDQICAIHWRDSRHNGSKILMLCRVTMSPLVPNCLACYFINQ